MKKAGLINSEISYAIAKMGHTDMLTIADSGLPIPKETQRIDLALKKGIPTFLETLDTIFEELKVEEVVIAKEMKTVSPKLYENLMQKLQQVEKEENTKIQIQEVTHETFKDLTRQSVCVVRTGEFTPYANIILKAGVVF
ncbi:D-ribose pyranase [Crassaminicella thermophila]|uniref:D-ribose pyranase n=2 Tax=Crassaminicella thermophila TaxID=2599308 RepID=A0A5C0SDI5_CRATE|nr:D-ribose pyranase [Crassaminicella thermophila]QEK10989.1 D-ribose pyranase [Crassaminicella thermophila]